MLPALGYVRNFLFPFIFIMLGFTYVKSNNIKSFLRSFIIIHFFIITIALYELIIDPKLWEVLNGRYINIARGFGDISILKTVIMNKTFYRVGGTFLDSVNFSYFLATSMAMFIYFTSLVKKRMELLLLFLLLSINTTILIFTFAKGGWLIAIVIFIGYFFIKDRQFTNYHFLYFILIIILIVSIFPIIISIFPTVIYHFYGLINSFSNITLFGHGIGNGGNFAKGLIGISHESWLKSSESGLGTMLYQMGILFTVLYYGIILILLHILNNRMKIFINSFPDYHSYIKLLKIDILLIYGWILGSSFQENAFSPNANFLIFLFLGMTLKITRGSFIAKV